MVGMSRERRGQMKQQNKTEEGGVGGYAADKTDIAEERTNRKIALAEQHLFPLTCSDLSLHAAMCVLDICVRVPCTSRIHAAAETRKNAHTRFCIESSYIKACA